MNEDSQYLFQLPDLQLQVFSFFELAALLGLAMGIYYLFRKGLFVFRNLGVLERTSRSYKIFNFISFVLPVLVFLLGFTQVSKDSFFISLLFFVIVSLISGFALLDPARSLIATMVIHLKGDLRESDFIQVGDLQGKILQIGPLSLTIQGRNGNKIFIPTHKVLQTSYEVHNRGGGSSVLIEVDGKIPKPRVERLAHLCPYKKENSDILITARNEMSLIRIEVHQRELKPLVQKYFANHLA